MSTCNGVPVIQLHSFVVYDFTVFQPERTLVRRDLGGFFFQNSVVRSRIFSILYNNIRLIRSSGPRFFGRERQTRLSVPCVCRDVRFGRNRSIVSSRPKERFGSKAYVSWLPLDTNHVQDCRRSF